MNSVKSSILSKFNFSLLIILNKVVPLSLLVSLSDCNDLELALLLRSDSNK